MSAPVCEVCGSVAPYGDARNWWIGAHRHATRRLTQRLLSALRAKSGRSRTLQDGPDKPNRRTLK